MVTHVSLQKMPSNPADLRLPRSATAAYVSATEATSSRAIEQQREAPANLPPIDPRMFETAVKDLSQRAQNLQRSLQFSIDESSGRTVIKVVDKETLEVIRQIPEQEVLALAARMEKGAGVLVKEEA